VTLARLGSRTRAGPHGTGMQQIRLSSNFFPVPFSSLWIMDFAGSSSNFKTFNDLPRPSERMIHRCV